MTRVHPRPCLSWSNSGVTGWPSGAGTARPSLVATAGGNRDIAWALDPTSDEAVTATVRIPRGAVSWLVQPVWVNLGGSGTGNWRLNVDIEDYDLGDTLGSPGTTLATSPSGGTPGGAATVATSFGNTAVALAPGRFARVTVRRDADHADDALANDIGLIGVKLVPRVVGP